MQLRARAESRALSTLLVLLLGVGGSGVGFAGEAAAPAAASPGGDPAVEPAVEAAVPAEGGGTEVPTGTYRGVVSDRRSGKPVPGAVVVFMNEESGETFETTTDATGGYEVHLPPGDYVVDIRVGKTVYRSNGTFREEAGGKRWTMDFTVGSKLTEKDLKIETTPRDIRVVATEPRPPIEGSKKMMEFLLFLGGLIAVGALAE